jgi:hypothetical protein
LLEALRRIPPSASIQAMPTLYPALGYERRKSVLLPGDSLRADYVLLRSDTTAWPFSREQVTRLAEDAVTAGGYVEAFRRGTFLVLRRAGPGSPDGIGSPSPGALLDPDPRRGYHATAERSTTRGRGGRVAEGSRLLSG